jgi:hypothetical protein
MVEGGEWREYQERRAEARERDRELERRRREEDEISEMLDEVERKIKEQQKVNEMVDEIAREYRERGYMDPEREHPSEEGDERECSKPEKKEGEEDEDYIEDLTGIDNLDDFEKALAEVFREYGHDPEKIKELWEEKFKGEVQEQTEECPEDIEGEGGEREGQSSSEMEESETYHVSPDGTVTVTKSAEEGVAETDESSEREVSDPELTEKDEPSEDSIPQESVPEPRRTTPEESLTESKHEQEDTEENITPESHRPKEVETPELAPEVSHSNTESTPMVKNEQKERVKEQHSDDLQQDIETESIEPQHPENSPVESEVSEDIEDDIVTESDGEDDEKGEESHRPWYAYFPEDAREPSSALPDDYSLSYFPEGDSVEEDVEDDESDEEHLHELLRDLPEEVLQHYREMVSEELESEKAYNKALEELLEMHELREEELDEGRRYVKFREMVREAEENEEELNLEEKSEELHVHIWKLKDWAKRRIRPRAFYKMVTLESQRKLHELWKIRILESDIDKQMIEGKMFNAFYESIAAINKSQLKQIWYRGKYYYQKEKTEEIAKKHSIETSELIECLRRFRIDSKSFLSFLKGYDKDELDDWRRKSPITEIISEEDFRLALTNNPYLRDRPTFEKDLYYVKVFFELKRLKIKSIEELRSFANRMQIPFPVVKGWWENIRAPRLFKSLLIHEKYRFEFIRSLDSRSFVCDPSLVYKTLSGFRDCNNLNVKLVSSALVNLLDGISIFKRIKFAHIQPYHQHGPSWFGNISIWIQRNLEAIQSELNSLLGLEINPRWKLQIGVVSNNLYFRLRSRHIWSWLNICSKENFHFYKLSDKKKLIRLARNRLGLRGNIEFGYLIGHLTDYSKRIASDNTNIDLRNTNKRLSGETLHLILDTLQLSLRDINEEVDYIGRGKRRWGVIRNPRFDSNLELTIITLMAIIISDGHIDPNCHITYTDNYRERLDQVIEVFRKLGDVDITETIHKTNKKTYLHAPAVVGRMLVHLGMNTGDKSILNKGLPDVILKGSRKAKIAYIRALISEDGSFSIDNGRAQFQWTRNVVLNAGIRSEAYNHTPKVPQRLLKLFYDFGKRRELFNSDGKGTIVRRIRIGRLKKLQYNKNAEVARNVKELLRIIENNRSNLMDDESAILKDLGIKTRLYPIMIRYIEDTKRISVTWQGHSATKSDTKVWGEKAPPADPRKFGYVKEWLDSLKNKERGD